MNFYLTSRKVDEKEAGEGHGAEKGEIPSCQLRVTPRPPRRNH